jgi:hypothetical protein
MSLLRTKSPAALLRDAPRAAGLFGSAVENDARDVRSRPVATPAVASAEVVWRFDSSSGRAGVARRPGR